MRRRALAALLGGIAAAALLAPTLTTQPASAARLEVSAAPIQTWKIIDGLPELPTPLPQVDLSACGDPSDYDEVVSGTPGPDTLTAGNGRQILVGLGGDDVLRGGNHDDCLLGGDGDDELFGDNGRDRLVGGPGADHLDGGTGKDRLDAGAEDGDACVSEGAPDELVGCNEDAVTPEGAPGSVADGAAQAPATGPRVEPGAAAGSAPSEPRATPPADAPAVPVEPPAAADSTTGPDAGEADGGE